MTSELTGGFDLCIEYSDRMLAAILGPLIEPGLGGVDAIFGSDSTAVAGRVDLLINNVTVNVLATGLSVNLSFFDSAFTVGTGSSGVASKLRGYVGLSGVNCGISPFQGTTEPTGPFLLTIDPQSSVTADVHWGPSSFDLVTSVMRAVGLTLVDANVAVGRAAARILASLNGPVTVGVKLLRAVSGDGSLSGPFSDIESVLLPAARGRPGVAAILLNVLAASAGMADKAAKTAIATAYGQLASFVVSPTALSSLYICPKLVTAMMLVPADTNVTPQIAAQILPPTCGTASGAPLGQLTLDHIDIAIEEGDVRLKGHAAGHDVGPGDYWNIETSFAATATVGLDAKGQLQAQAQPTGPPSVAVSVDWWKATLVGVFGGPIGIGIAEGIGKKVYDRTVNDVTKGLKDSLKSLANQFQLPNTLAAILTPQAAELHPTGLVLQGTPPALPSMPPLTFFPEAWFDITSRAVSVVDGPWRVAHGLLCLHKDYKYHGRRQQTECTIKAADRNLPGPTTMHWTLGGLAIGEGQSTLHDPTGNVILDYSLTGDSLWLRNAPDTNFGLDIGAEIINADGLQATATTRIQLVGSARVYEAAYHDDLLTCIRGLAGSLSGKEHAGTTSQISGKVAASIIGSIIGSHGGDPLGGWGAAIREVDTLVRLAGQDVPWLRAAAAEQAIPLRTMV